MKPLWSGFLDGLALPVTAPLKWLRWRIAASLVGENGKWWSEHCTKMQTESYRAGFAAGQQFGRDEMFNTLTAYLDERHGIPDFNYSDLERAKKGMVH